MLLSVDVYRNNSDGEVSHLEGRLRMRLWLWYHCEGV